MMVRLFIYGVILFWTLYVDLDEQVLFVRLPFTRHVLFFVREVMTIK